MAAASSHHHPPCEALLSAGVRAAGGCLQDPSTVTDGTANGYITGQVYFDAFQVRSDLDVQAHRQQHDIAAAGRTVASLHATAVAGCSIGAAWPPGSQVASGKSS